MTTYKSKIGKEMLLILVLIFIGTLILMIYLGNWLGLVIILMVILFIFYLFKNIYYQISDNQLIVKAGFLINTKIDINTIKKIAAIRSFVSAPATSIDRLEISFNKYDTIEISPLERDEFIEHLTKLNPQIVFDNQIKN
jgi:Ca2+/Na+ antiporter